MDLSANADRRKQISRWVEEHRPLAALLAAIAALALYAAAFCPLYRAMGPVATSMAIIPAGLIA